MSKFPSGNVCAGGVVVISCFYSSQTSFSARCIIRIEYLHLHCWKLLCYLTAFLFNETMPAISCTYKFCAVYVPYVFNLCHFLVGTIHDGVDGVSAVILFLELNFLLMHINSWIPFSFPLPFRQEQISSWWQAWLLRPFECESRTFLSSSPCFPSSRPSDLCDSVLVFFVAIRILCFSMILRSNENKDDYRCSSSHLRDPLLELREQKVSFTRVQRKSCVAFILVFQDAWLEMLYWS